MKVIGSTRVTLVAVLVAVLLVAYRDTFESMVHIWISNTTYNHGFLIPLIAAFFAWQARHEALATPARVYWPGLIVLAAASILWLFAVLVNVQVIAQLASVALVSCIVFTIAGPRQAAVFVLPLTYLLFMVPFGQGIVPLLMDWTAHFTVFALRVAGIPVVRDGLYFSTATGNFEVAEACSGVRYLLASVATGVAFAFVAYTHWKKRALFIAASVIVPIIANGLRAFGIVLIAHYSDMQLATGVDHFIYGWFFFGVIMFLLVMVGAHFADKEVEYADQHDGNALPTDAGADFPAVLTAGGMVLVILLAAPAFVGYRTSVAVQPQPALPVAATFSQSWRGPQAAESAWRLGYMGAAATASGSYTDGTRRIEVRVAAYGDQQQGAELINSQNSIADGEVWQSLDLGTVSTASNEVPKVRAVRLAAGPRSYLVWYWYQQGTQITTSSYEAKWLETLAVFTPTAATIVAIAAEGPSEDLASEVLATFLKEAGWELQVCAANTSDGHCNLPDTPAPAR